MDKILIAGKYDSSQDSRVVWSEGISYAVTNGHKDGMPKIIYKVINPDVSGADICRTIKANYHKVSTANLMRGGTFGATGVMEVHKPINTDKDGNARTIRACYGKCGYDSVFLNTGHGITGVMEIKQELHMEDGCLVDAEGRRYRIRKLTPREVGRLMDVSDEDIDRIEATGLSKTAMYKMYGNSIVVNVMFHIFRKLFIEKECEEQQLSLF